MFAIDSDSGVLWLLPQSPLDTTPADLLQVEPYWTNADCTGTAYVPVSALPFPRVAFLIDGRAGVFVVPDAPQVVNVVGLGSASAAGSCQVNAPAYTARAVAVSALVPVTAPAALPGTPPYHPEAL
jgi:hypothetical protein